MKLFKAAILIVVMGMLIPILVYSDNVQKERAVADRNYDLCASIRYDFLYHQCLNGVQRRKMNFCEDFSQEGLRNSCVQNTKEEKKVILNRFQEQRGFQFSRYIPIWGSLLGILFFLFMIKGPGLKIHPEYEKMIRRVSEVLPESDYFARQNFKTMAAVVVGLALGLILFIEVLATFYKG